MSTVTPDNKTYNDLSKKPSLPRFGSSSTSAYKYISGKFYHPSTRFEDLQGLSINKSGTCDLIQANTKFIAVPISGPGGRVGIINARKPGRLPIHIPSVLCNSEVNDFKFDPFDENILITVSNDNKIRVWEIPEEGLEEDFAEPKYVFGDESMDRVQLIEFHPTSKNILLSASDDLGHPTIRLWNLETQKSEITFKHPGLIFSCAWSPDGQHIATTSKEKKVYILDARTGQTKAEGNSHSSIRPSRLVWLSNTEFISVGFGLGSSREILLFNVSDLSKPVAKKQIDISPSVMSIYYDFDCHLLFVAGRGDRTIHTYHVEDEIVPIRFLPKRTCSVKEIEIDKFYRLTPSSIETVGVHVSRARPEYFQDDIFVPTLDLEHPAQSADNWFKGENKQLERISLQPEDMPPLSTAPPPPSQAQSKAKFEMGKKYVSEEQRKKEQMERMFAFAKSIESDDEEIKPKVNPEEEEVAEEEWDD
ncbi:WD40-repeat-containing domain protein [Cokeromyces recurvatus]|uniref:WD40-repeat-containing domain protein n=1 Tax=Cokeromyces recurvatus TaxID=90255 RepID=UPI00221F529F|nr:WD40-repeat-containing domain protein [Cokeromyces recurvatus]KAI7899420.1 WD40-repeat-containing domain protein [Cokeromyces recurvatus]